VLEGEKLSIEDHHSAAEATTRLAKHRREVFLASEIEITHVRKFF